MPEINEVLQQFSPGNLVQLFQLDATLLGGPVYYFTPTSDGEGGTIVFDGQSYTPIDIEVTGYEWNGQGAFPTPRIAITNTNLAIHAAAITYGDLLGATLTRIRTFRQYLDDGAEADPTAILPIDVHRIERKSNHNNVSIEWELSASIDQEGVKIPKRQILKNACTHTYRTWNGASFDYTKATCPYAGTNYFNLSGTQVLNPAEDKCSKQLGAGCRKRFGENGELPFRGFPGVAVI